MFARPAVTLHTRSCGAYLTDLHIGADTEFVDSHDCLYPYSFLLHISYMIFRCNRHLKDDLGFFKVYLLSAAK